MKFPDQPLWNFANGYFVSTADTFDQGLETMVFPASDNAAIVKGFWQNWVKGVDFNNPLEEYTRHYTSVADAKRGHEETVRAIKEKFGGKAQ